MDGYPVVIAVPLLWGDEDAFGHVNNTVYLRWCETARVDYLNRVRLWPATPPSGIGPILAHMSCDYERPLNYPDTVEVGSRVTKIGNTSLHMEHCVYSRQHGAVAARVRSILVTYDYTAGRPVRVPAAVRAAIEALEGSAGTPR